MNKMQQARKPRRSIRAAVSFILLCAILLSAGCKTVSYRFNDAAVPAHLKTIKIQQIQNKASYVNPTLTQRLSDRLRQKITSQTKLTQVNPDNPNADWEVTGVITSYSFTTSGISQGEAATNRLTITVQITRVDQTNDETKEYTVSKNFDFSSRLSIQQAEANLGDEIIRGLTDDIFNRLFSEW